MRFGRKLALLDGAKSLDEERARFLEVRPWDRTTIAKAQVGGFFDGRAEILRKTHGVQRHLECYRGVGSATALVVENVEGAVGVDVGAIDTAFDLNEPRFLTARTDLDT